MLLLSSCQSTPSVVRLHMYSRRDLARGFLWYCPGITEVHHPVSESASIVDLHFSEAFHTNVLVFTEPNVSCQSWHVHKP